MTDDVEAQQALLKRWVAALRSGAYAQATRALHQIDPVREEAQFCCLGVLCHLLETDGVLKSKHNVLIFEGGIGYCAYSAVDGDKWSAILLPSKAASMLPSDVDTLVLAGMNDGNNSTDDKKPATFEEIADYIETQYITN